MRRVGEKKQLRSEMNQHLAPTSCQRSEILKNLISWVLKKKSLHVLFNRLCHSATRKNKDTLSDRPQHTSSINTLVWRTTEKMAPEYQNQDQTTAQYHGSVISISLEAAPLIYTLHGAKGNLNACIAGWKFDTEFGRNDESPRYCPCYPSHTFYVLPCSFAEKILKKYILAHLQGRDKTCRRLQEPGKQ